MYCLLIRPGTASALQASAGRANLWSTSVLVIFKEFRDIGSVGWMYCLLIRPGTASALQASAGRANLWSTSVLVMFKEFRDIGSVGADEDASSRGEFVDMYLSHASLIPTL